MQQCIAAMCAAALLLAIVFAFCVNKLVGIVLALLDKLNQQDVLAPDWCAYAIASSSSSSSSSSNTYFAAAVPSTALMPACCSTLLLLLH
jgi:hypothetical protein